MGGEGYFRVRVGREEGKEEQTWSIGFSLLSAEIIGIFHSLIKERPRELFRDEREPCRTQIAVVHVTTARPELSMRKD